MSEERIAIALERIAEALERMARLDPPARDAEQIPPEPGGGRIRPKLTAKGAADVERILREVG